MFCVWGCLIVFLLLLKKRDDGHGEVRKETRKRGMMVTCRFSEILIREVVDFSFF